MDTFSKDAPRSGSLLTDLLISSTSGNRYSLPGLLAAMARREVDGFAALRPHQRPAWHMFLVQLAALALDRSGQAEPPEAEADWAALLRGLTPDFADDEPWYLVVTDRKKPAFMQPPDPGGLKWTPVPTPDALDMLITSRNHDLKSAIATQAAPEDWLFALVSLQTCEGFGGRDNYGIARMNGGSSSRAMLGMVPVETGNAAPVPSASWARDLRRLLQLRADNATQGPCIAGGEALLWLKQWPEGHQLELPSLDPWFIEICRRVRLTPQGAERANSKAARIDAKAFNGAIGDPWAPVHRTEGKALTLGEGDFTYKRLCALMLDGDWIVPDLARPGPQDDGDMVLVASAFSRGNSKTDGFKSRTVPVPKVVVPGLFRPQTADLSADQRGDVAKVDKALRDGLAVMAARGDWSDIGREDYARAATARAAFDRRVDAIFFPALWDRMQAPDKRDAASRFQQQLVTIAQEEFHLALPGIPCAVLFRPRAEARARRAFWARLKRENIDTRKEERDDAA